MSGPPILQGMNNGTLSSEKAMPAKDLTSDGGSSFAMSRVGYIRSMFSQSAPTQTVALEKKWYGNKDASQIAVNRRIAEVGQGSLNTTASPMSYTTTSDTNTARQARNRVRSGGAVVPSKRARVMQIM
jgi:hypothetical protein